MYNSPIEIIYKQAQMQMENDIFRAVQRYEINVDKEELIRALSYDRQQYEKGYMDGKAAAAAEIVRCKDCIGKAHWYKNDYGCTICGLSGLFVVEDRDFCSYGERKEVAEGG